MHESTIQLLESILQYLTERLYVLENTLPRTSSEREVVMGLRSLTSVANHLVEQEHERESAN